jgi:hypothetical protein
MKLMKTVFGTVMGASVLVLTVASASAAIVCSEGACWHVTDRHAYPPEARVTIHEDDWKWGANDKYAWREHEGRGYWRGDHWVTW